MTCGALNIEIGDFFFFLNRWCSEFTVDKLLEAISNDTADAVSAT